MAFVLEARPQAVVFLCLVFCRDFCRCTLRFDPIRGRIGWQLLQLLGGGQTRLPLPGGVAALRRLRPKSNTKAAYFMVYHMQEWAST